MNNLQEFLAGTSPTNAASALRVRVAADYAGDAVVIRWSSESNRCYGLERSTNLLDGFVPIERNIPATPPENTYTDRVDRAADCAAVYYRIRLGH